MNSIKINKIAVLFLITGKLLGDCPENYTVNPLYTEGNNSYNECIPEHFEFRISTLFHAFLFEIVLFNEDEVTENDWVGAFNGEDCVGARKWDVSSCGGGVCDIFVYGDDGSDLTDGYMSSGDTPSFKLFNHSTGDYYDAFPSEVWTFSHLNTTIVPYLQSCSGGNLDIDNDNICDYADMCIGDNSTGDIDTDGICDSDDDCVGYFDCAGECGGSATADCAGTCGGSAVEDECGICGGTGIPEGECNCQGSTVDCAGTCGGTAIDEDVDGICDDVDDCIGELNELGECLNSEIPNEFILYQNYPNPFNPYTIIEFDLDKNDYIDLSIFDLNGKKVKQLVKKYMLNGNHKIRWNGKDDYSKQLPSSNYIVYLKGTNKAYYKKLTLIK